MESIFYITKKSAAFMMLLTCTVSLIAQPYQQKSEVTPGVIFQILASELSIISGNVPAAAATYVDIAKRTKDPEAAKRATELSLNLGDHETALKTAEIWEKNSRTI